MAYKLVTFSDHRGAIVAFDPRQVAQALWEDGHTKLRLFFGNQLLMPLLFSGSVAQRVWEVLVALEEDKA